MLNASMGSLSLTRSCRRPGFGVSNGTLSHTCMRTKDTFHVEVRVGTITGMSDSAAPAASAPLCGNPGHIALAANCQFAFLCCSGHRRRDRASRKRHAPLQTGSHGVQPAQRGGKAARSSWRSPICKHVHRDMDWTKASHRRIHLSLQPRVRL